MTSKEYNQIKDSDTALAVRLAVTMGWLCSLQYSITQGGTRVFVEDPNDGGWSWTLFDPFTDARIPYGLMGRGVHRITSDYGMFCAVASDVLYREIRGFSESKTQAIINAYCQADPIGHWAKFIREKE